MSHFALCRLTATPILLPSIENVAFCSCPHLTVQSTHEACRILLRAFSRSSPSTENIAFRSCPYLTVQSTHGSCCILHCARHPSHSHAHPCILQECRMLLSSILRSHRRQSSHESCRILLCAGLTATPTHRECRILLLSISYGPIHS